MAKKPTIEYDIVEVDMQSTGLIVPMTFDTDAKGSVFGRYNGYAVYKDRDSPIDLEPKKTYFVRLKDKTVESGCYFAFGMREVDTQFFLEACTNDKMAFLQSVFMKGGKPTEALLDGIAKCSPEIVERLEKGPELLQRSTDMSGTVSMYKTKLDNANESLRKKNEEIRKLKEQVKTKSSKDEGAKDEVKNLKRELTDSESKVRELADALVKSEEQVATRNGTISNMEFAMNLERQELVDRVDQAERARDAVIKARKEKEDALERRSKELDEREREMGSVTVGVSEEAYEGVHKELELARQNLDEQTALTEALSVQVEERDRLIASLSQRISELTKANTEVRSRIPAYEMVFRPNVTVRRDSRTTISSDWFTESRYTVLMSGDAKRLLIRPDPDGSVTCSGFALSIPKLASIRTYTGPTYLDTEFAPDMGSVEVVL